MEKVLVTGAAGYIGAHAAVELTKAGYETVLIDNFSKSNDTLLKGIEKITKKPVNFHEGDCLDENFLQRIFRTQGPFSCVMHFAAYKSVGESVQEPLMYYRNNIGSLVALLSVMHENQVKDFVFSSSCTVYGQPDIIPVDESAPFKRAESPYGATKQMCERILEDTYTKGFRMVSLRYFNPIGADPSACIGELPIGPPNNLVPYITQTAIGKREKLTVFGNDYNTPDGTCIRDFIHVVDLAYAHIKAMEYLRKQNRDPHYQTFNLGSGLGVSVMQLINQFKEVTKVDLPFAVGPRRPGDVEQVYGNPAKANAVLHWETKFSIADALLHAWQWEKQLASRA